MLWLLVYAGLGIAVVGLVLVARPMPRIGVRTRLRGVAVAVPGVILTSVALGWPARELRVRDSPQNQLDAVMPVWQFHEKHWRQIAAPPERVMDAIRSVTADEIRLFRLLTWIRRGGRNLPPGVLNAGDSASLIDIATTNGFVWLHDAPGEIVVGTIISRPPGSRDTLSAELFKMQLPPGWTLATMNFFVRWDIDAPGRSFVSTETRVYANSASARRRFAAYWRVIYPGSALIRRGWLGAIERRSTRT